jgi:hypothetical protein
MPYIGQRPATGEANSFKILDDISNYTLTFGSSDIDTSADTIAAREHRFVTGQRVTYGNGGGTDPTGLSNGTVYYIIVEDRHSFKLAENANNAASGSAINISTQGSGASHTINVAFDGVNTKFKATHTNGTKADITQSGQLMVSVNGVLQQPHDNTTTPTTGYATDHTSTIIFSAAPATNDQFFGRLIASNFATFDISDNTVDNFTGDGNTSTFTLSKNPPNNESVLVTIDGVVQYPDTHTIGIISVCIIQSVFKCSIVTCCATPILSTSIKMNECATVIRCRGSLITKGNIATRSYTKSFC